MLRAARELLALCVGRRKILRVSGASMAPTLPEGSVIAVRRSDGGLPSLGQIVVVRDPHTGRRLVKRCSSHGANTFAVCSDNPHEARDSRSFGPLSRQHLIGLAVWRWLPGVGFDQLRPGGRGIADATS